MAMIKKKELSEKVLKKIYIFNFENLSKALFLIDREIGCQYIFLKDSISKQEDFQ